MLYTDIISNWKELAKSSVEDIINSPAYAMPVRWNDEEAILNFSGTRPIPSLFLKIRLANEEQILAFPILDTFPNLSKMGDNIKSLPEELLLAAVELDLAPFLTVLEDAAKRQLAILGIADEDDPRLAKAKTITVYNSNRDVLFSALLSFSPALAKTFGELKFLSPRHPDIASMEMDASIHIAAFQLDKQDEDNMAQGDAILLPELQDETAWRCAVVAGNKFNILAELKGNTLILNSSPALLQDSQECFVVELKEHISLTLGELLSLTGKDETVTRSIEDVNSMLLFKDGRLLAGGTLNKFGAAYGVGLQYVNNTTEDTAP